MASGSFSKTVGNRDYASNEYIKVWWSAKADPANNRSLVRAYAKMYRPHYLYVDYNQRIELYINGTKYTGSRYGWRGQGWTEAYIDKSRYVTHNSDGKKSIYIRCRTEVKAWLNSYVGWVDTGNHLCKLDNLARKSSFSLNKSSAKLGESITVSLSRSSSAVRHSITMKVGSKTFTILAKSNDNGSTKSYSYTLTPDNILPYMTGKSATATVTLKTYNGNTSLGTSSKSFKINLRTSDKPSVSSSNITITPVPISPNTSTEYYIQGKSKAQITITPTVTSGTAGAIKTYTVTVNGVSKNYTSNVITTDALNKSGTNTISVTVTDGRGMVSDATSKTIEVLEYSVPVISAFSVDRCDSDGTLNKSGTYAKVAFNYKFSSCGGVNSATIVLSDKNEVDSNDYTVKETWEKSDGSGTISQVFGTYSVDDSFDFKLVITDDFNATNTYYAEMGTEELLVDFASNAVAIGKVAERQNAFEVEWPAYFEDTIYGTVSANTSDERLKYLVDDDIEPLLRVYDQLYPIFFTYKHDADNKVLLGHIAQYVVELMEQEDLDWKKYGLVYQDETTGYFSLNYEFLNQLGMYKIKILEDQMRYVLRQVEKFSSAFEQE